MEKFILPRTNVCAIKVINTHFSIKNDIPSEEDATSWDSLKTEDEEDQTSGQVIPNPFSTFKGR